MGSDIWVAVAPDDNCFRFAVVAMTSILETTKSNVHFIILHSGYIDRTVQALDSLKRYPNCILHYKYVDKNVFNGFQNSSWTTVQTWFRALLPDLFPELNKVIYVDCDVILRSDISQMWDIDVSNVKVGAVLDVLYTNQLSQYLQMKSSAYFNAGVLIINCEKWRKENLFEKIRHCAQNDPSIRYGDQDVLNKVIDEDKIIISPKYNYLETWDRGYQHDYKGQDKVDYENCKKDAVLVHFAGGKPTRIVNQNTFKDEFWNVAKRTCVYTELLEIYKADCDCYYRSVLNKQS